MQRKFEKEFAYQLFTLFSRSRLASDVKPPQDLCELDLLQQFINTARLDYNLSE